MTQIQHTLVGIVLMLITVDIYEFFYPREKEEKYWQDKFNQWFGL